MTKISDSRVKTRKKTEEEIDCGTLQELLATLAEWSIRVPQNQLSVAYCWVRSNGMAGGEDGENEVVAVGQVKSRMAENRKVHRDRQTDSRWAFVKIHRVFVGGSGCG